MEFINFFIKFWVGKDFDVEVFVEEDIDEMEEELKDCKLLIVGFFFWECWVVRV